METKFIAIFSRTFLGCNIEASFFKINLNILSLFTSSYCSLSNGFLQLKNLKISIFHGSLDLILSRGFI